MKAAVIYADPPWRFQVRSKKGMGRSPKYPTMTHDKIKALPVEKIAARNCALLLWTSGPFLMQSLAVGTAWGFTYKTIAFVWSKLNPRMNQAMEFSQPDWDSNWVMGTGYYTRANAEIVLLFTRGRLTRRSRSVRQLVVAPHTGEHSGKPPVVMDRIEQLFSGPYVELFARQTRPGWHCLGNEIDGLDIRNSLNLLSEKPEDSHAILPAD